MRAEAGQSHLLRIVLVHDRNRALPVWVAWLIERLADDPAFALVGTVDGVPEETGQGRFAPFLELERMAMPRPPRGATAARAAGIIDGLPVLEPGGGAPGADIALALTGYQLDRSNLASIAAQEWSLRMAGAAPHHAEEATQKALAAGAPLVPIELVARSPDDSDPRILLSARYNIKPSAVLLAEFLRDKAVIFVMRALRCRAAGREIDTGATVHHMAEPSARQSVYQVDLMQAVSRRALGHLRQKLGRINDFWELRLGRGDAGLLDLTTLQPLPRLQWAMADPFLLEHDGKLWLFYEAYDRNGGDGWIEVARLEGTRLEPLGPALRCDYHLSFPQVFVHDGEIYMMPETNQTNRIELWRATRFPLGWELHATALEGACPADSCLFNHGGAWWLLSNISEHYAFQEHSSALYLYSVDGPALKHVTPHPLNPVVIGSDVARNGGCVVAAQGQLFRPSQNNSHGVYGYGLNLMRIDRLDAQDYRETLVQRITPGDLPGTAGVHHVSFAAGHFVLDVYRERQTETVA